jgi:hypothetical protein
MFRILAFAISLGLTILSPNRVSAQFLNDGHYVNSPSLFLYVQHVEGTYEHVEVHATVTSMSGFGQCTGEGLKNIFHYYIGGFWNAGGILPTNYLSGTCTGSLECGGWNFICGNPDPNIAPNAAIFRQTTTNQINMSSKLINAPFYLTTPLREQAAARPNRKRPSTIVRLFDPSGQTHQFRLVGLRADPGNVRIESTPK